MSAISSGNPYLVFSGLAFAVVLMPGADTILVFRTSRALGTRTGLMTAVGVVTGPVLWGVFSGIGVALVIARNKSIYTALALLGALYLMYLAYGCFKSAADGGATPLDAADEAPADSGSMRNAYVTGLLTNLLNPKIGVFYLSVMPGLFQGRAGPWDGGSLGLIQASMGIVFLSCVALLAGKARRYLSSRRASLTVEILAGTCLLAFAVYVIWSVLHSPGGLEAAGGPSPR
ncbi:LysE family translocator [Actinomadura fibrosa]|uniref:LysE family translocator n=1 Tax=Actinomadura fibrosa TaxID=111802 RepID=A0ABW2XHB1_9ACTN|nr:LysE family translocator [Actinomadura fibrosa]